MQSKERDPDKQQLIDDLLGLFIDKKRLSNNRYQHLLSAADEKHLEKAAELCKNYELDAASYVQLMYDRMGGKKQFFTLACLQGTKAQFYLEEAKQSAEGLKIEVTNASLDIAEVWRYQHELVMIYARNGDSIENILMDSGIKLFAWYRILASPERIPAVIKKYARIARKELNSKILDFIKSRNLDLDRIFGAHE